MDVHGSVNEEARHTTICCCGSKVTSLLLDTVTLCYANGVHITPFSDILVSTGIITKGV